MLQPSRKKHKRSLPSLQSTTERDYTAIPKDNAAIEVAYSGCSEKDQCSTVSSQSLKRGTKKRQDACSFRCGVTAEKNNPLSG
eukprot:6313373-Amphidinium_carterae.2